VEAAAVENKVQTMALVVLEVVAKALVSTALQILLVEQTLAVVLGVLVAEQQLVLE
jgi:hypothetical protein